LAFSFSFIPFGKGGVVGGTGSCDSENYRASKSKNYYGGNLETMI